MVEGQQEQERVLRAPKRSDFQSKKEYNQAYINYLKVRNIDKRTIDRVARGLRNPASWRKAHPGDRE